MKFIETLSPEDQQFIHDWVDALRSGNFAQTTNVLATPDFTAFCCIGVAGVISPDCPVVLNDACLEFTRAPWCSEEPYKKINRIFDLARDNKHVLVLEALVDLNDVKKADFNQIADYVEMVCDREVA